MYFINDPYFSALPKDMPNYHIGYCGFGRSSNNALLTHIDSYVPFKGKVSNYNAMLICFTKADTKKWVHFCSSKISFIW